MPVRIRLTRAGSKNRPFFRVVVADSRKRRDGRFIEKLGYYDPLPKQEQIQIDQERVDHWVSQGAQISETVKRLLKRMNKLAKAPVQVAPAKEAPVPSAPAAAEPAARPEPAETIEAAAPAAVEEAAKPEAKDAKPKKKKKAAPAAKKKVAKKKAAAAGKTVKKKKK